MVRWMNKFKWIKIFDSEDYVLSFFYQKNIKEITIFLIFEMLFFRIIINH